MKNTIKQIVFEEFSKLTGLIEKDFAANYKRKVNTIKQNFQNLLKKFLEFLSFFQTINRTAKLKKSGECKVA